MNHTADKAILTNEQKKESGGIFLSAGLRPGNGRPGAERERYRLVLFPA